ncbi:MAG: hypothetical protein R6W76_21675 [Caldilinea sp.]
MASSTLSTRRPSLTVQHRWTLLFGALTLIWAVNTVATATNREDPYAATLLVTMLATIVICDWLLARALRMLPDTAGLHVLAFVAPVLLFGAYFFALLQTEGTRWSIHLVGAAIFLPGAARLLLNYVARPPAIAAMDNEMDIAGETWTHHKCERIARFAAHHAALIRAHRPGCIAARICARGHPVSTTARWCASLPRITPCWRQVSTYSRR